MKKAAMIVGAVGVVCACLGFTVFRGTPMQWGLFAIAMVCAVIAVMILPKPPRP